MVLRELLKRMEYLLLRTDNIFYHIMSDVLKLIGYIASNQPLLLKKRDDFFRQDENIMTLFVIVFYDK